MAEDLLTRLELGHAPADRLDLAGYVDAQDLCLGPAGSFGYPQRVRLAAHEVPVERIDRDGADPHEHPVLVD